MIDVVAQFGTVGVPFGLHWRFNSDRSCLIETRAVHNVVANFDVFKQSGVQLDF